jgi:DivIVA domain-containing protein
MSGALTPDAIENAVFAVRDRGYDPDEVEAFLKRIGDELKSREGGPAKRAKPYEALGKEMAALLEHAQQIAHRTRVDAEEKAAQILQEAHEASKKEREAAEETRRRAQREAEDIHEEASTTASRLKHQGEQFRQVAEAEASLMRQDVRNEIRRAKEDAKKRAAEILVAAQYEGKEQARILEERIRKLHRAEVVLRERVQLLQDRAKSLVHEAEPQAEEEPARPR